MLCSNGTFQLSQVKGVNNSIKKTFLRFKIMEIMLKLTKLLKISSIHFLSIKVKVYIYFTVIYISLEIFIRSNKNQNSETPFHFLL